MGTKQITPEKSYRIVRQAVVDGTIKKPSRCQKCHAPEKFGIDGRSLLQGHHYLGYEKPLVVTWLCSTCHGKEDRRASGELNSHAKLNINAVSEIRRRYQRLSFNVSNVRELAAEYGVDRTTIQSIVAKRSWT